MEKDLTTPALDVLMLRDNSNFGKQTESFEQAHQEELGVKRYMSEGLRGTLPMVAAIVGAAAGYFVLHKPVRALRPGVFDVVNGTKQVTKKLANMNRVEAEKALMEAAELVQGVTIDPAASSVKGLVKDAFKQLNTPEKKEAFLKALDIQKIEPFAEKWAAAAIGYFAASTPVSLAVGYRNWKRKEMPRIAMQEVNEDISKLELFQPTDKELQSEVIRLREMVDKQAEHNALSGPKGTTPETTISTAAGVEASRVEAPQHDKAV